MSSILSPGFSARASPRSTSISAHRLSGSRYDGKINSDDMIQELNGILAPG
jgi:hypothetical protein